MRLVMVSHIIYFTLVDYHPVRIANAKLRALTISRKPFYVYVYVCVCTMHVGLCIQV